jgi:hypothetical protein
MTQSATDHTASNDVIITYELKSMWKQMIVHAFRVVYQHVFTRTDEIYEKIRSDQMMSWPRYAPHICPIQAGSSTASDRLFDLCILFNGRQTSSEYGKRSAALVSIKQKAKRAHGAAEASYTPGFERFLTVSAATHIRQTLGHPIQGENIGPGDMSLVQVRFIVYCVF